MPLQLPKWLINYVIYNVGWFGCVLGGSSVALPLTAFILYIHLNYVTQHREEGYFIFAVGCIGAFIDNALFFLGVLTQTPNASHAPLWMFCIWLIFASLINHSLAWIQQRYLLASTLGFFAGPLAYWSGAQLSNVTISPPTYGALLTIGALWAFAMPLILLIVKPFNRRLQHKRVLLENP